MKIMLLSLLAVGIAFGQNQSAPATTSFFSTMTDPLMVSMAAYNLAQVAQGTTAWKFTVAGKHYTVSPAQKTGIAAASTIGAAAIAHRWPKLKTPLTILLSAASAYYGGKAYYQAQNHGEAAATPPPTAVAHVQIRR